MKKKTSPYQLDAAREPTLQIYSYGHSGTGMLRKILQKSSADYDHSMSNDPHNRFTDLAPAQIELIKKVIVIYADPREALISLFSKKFSRVQRHCELMNVEPIKAWISKENPVIPKALIHWSAFHEFMYSWLNTEAPFDIAFVKYENLIEDESLKQLRDFATVQEPEINFIQRVRQAYQPRPTRRTLGAPSEVDLLDEIFEDLIGVLNKLPPFWIKKKIK